MRAEETTLQVTVAGAGVAGLAAALALARHGNRVTVIERDGFHVGAALDAPTWARRGIPHFLQPHAFIPRGRRELRSTLPDVYAALIEAGARDVDIRGKLPGSTVPADEDLQYVAVRRPLIEWALRRAVAAEPRITVRHGRVDGVDTGNGRLTALRVDGSAYATSVVVDALGRRTPLAGGPEATSDCGVTYYCRYYRQRDGFELPDGPWFLSPRADVGYLAFASFPGDNRTFAAVLAVPPGVHDWRIFNEPAAFEAAVATMPALRSWVDPDGVDPITDVLPMAGLRNSVRARPGPGVFPAGDALCHTDPTLAHGLAFALVHADALAAALGHHTDVDDARAAYLDAVMPEARERYEFSTALDAQRLRMWNGEPVDPTRPGGDYALFTMAAGGAAAAVDPDVFRVFNRRIGLLDRLSVLDGDAGMQARIEECFARLRATPRPPAGPARDELLAIARKAAA
jgi:2-polyprenyl-6-methoxyphenol hydroxylase-like FAD-dependent oxidoreductase